MSKTVLNFWPKSLVEIMYRMAGCHFGGGSVTVANTNEEAGTGSQAGWMFKV